MCTVHNQATIYPAVHMNSSFKSCQLGGFPSASNVLPIHVLRKQKERNILCLSLCLKCFGLLAPLCSRQMEWDHSLSSYIVGKGRTDLWLGWGSYDLASIVLVNGLQWQGTGTYLHPHPSSFIDRGMVHCSQNCSQHVEACNSRLKALVIFFTFRWFLKSWWVFTCIKILKNNLNNLFSNISSCTLPTWILCHHSKVKSPAPAPLQSVIHANITSHCFLPAGQERTWT